jgi:hypothetical protein
MLDHEGETCGCADSERSGWRRFDLPPAIGFNGNAVPVSNPTDPKIDRWLRKQPPRVELALRYSIRGRFMKAIGKIATPPPKTGKR